MPVYRDEGVVLRTQRLGEADRIVTLLTKEHGRVRAVAKGVRRTSSKFGARLEPFMVVDLQLFAGRNLDTVTQAVTLASYGAEIVADYDAFTAASAIVEAAERIAEAEVQRSLYLLCIGALRALSRAEHEPRLVLDSYLLRALSVAGWAPSFDDCARCGEAGPHDRVSMPLGGAVCRSCAPPGAIAVSADAMAHLDGLLRGDWALLDAAPGTVRDRASGVVAAYAQYHLERSLRSLHVIDRERHGASRATAPAPAKESRA